MTLRFGLPVVPAWAPWFMRELQRRRTVQPLLGLGCSPVLVKGNKKVFLSWIGKALKAGSICIREENGAIAWKLAKNFLEQSVLPAGVVCRLSRIADTKKATEESVRVSS